MAYYLNFNDTSEANLVYNSNPANGDCIYNKPD